MISRRRVADLWRRSDVTVRDLPLALVLLAASLVPGFHGHGTEFGDPTDRPIDAFGYLAIVLQCLPLALRRRWPAASLGLVSAGFALDQLREYHTVAGTGLPLALVSAGAHLGRHRRATVAGYTVAFVALSVALRVGATTGEGRAPAGYVVFFLALAAAWAVGAWLRSTRQAEDERRGRIAEATRTAERTRIARELHDVVTHHVTAMVVQAEAARYLTAAPEKLDASLTAVTATGRRAITDLRHLLDLLNPEHGTDADVEARTPSIGEVRTLVEQTRLAGQPVELTEEGEPAGPTGSAELVAYRVVQEALTNSLKYDHGGLTAVHVRYGAQEITVRVSSDGSGSGAASPGGSGRGLAGLRERVDVLGGRFSAGHETGGTFVVRASIPAGSS